MVLYPYRKGKRWVKGKCWVFDDAEHGLKEEAFVLGMSEIISAVVAKKRIPNACNGFQLTFSAEPFDHDIKLTWFERAEYSWMVEGKKYILPGNWYHTGNYFKKKKTGWLCPALLCYFDNPPPKIYCKAEPLPVGIDPIWHEGEKFAFVSV